MLSYGEIDGLFLSGTYNEAQFEAVYHYAEKNGAYLTSI